MRYIELDTPALLIDRERLTKNLKDMQSYADAHGVALRPHTKTHKCPEIAKMQLAAGACGTAHENAQDARRGAPAGGNGRARHRRGQSRRSRSHGRGGAGRFLHCE